MSPTKNCPACSSPGALFFAVRRGHEILRCISCGTLFVHPLPERAPAIYDQNYFCGGGDYGYVDYDADKLAMSREFVTAIQRIEKALNGKRGTLLDVGAATGVFMAMARDRGWNVAGIELSPFAAEKGRKQGLDIRAGELPSLNLPERAYDAVTAWDVMEHVRDPHAYIMEMGRLLRPGGVLALTTPNASSLFARLMGPRWHLLNPPEHLVCFSEKGMAVFLDRAGFQTVLQGVPNKSFPVSYALHIAGSRFRMRWMAHLGRSLKSNLLGRLSLPLNFRDNMFVIARKR